MSKNSSFNSAAFILASSSPRRKELLQYFGFPFSVRPPSASEEITNPLSPAEYVQTLARRKATAISQKSPGSIVLGADTVVAHQGNIIGKPENTGRARSVIRSLSNSTHRVMTGVSLIRTDKNGEIADSKTFCESTDVTFGVIENELIDDYLKNGHPLDKAGGYGIQDKWGAIFTKQIEGDFYNVMGLPVHELYQQLKDFDPELFKQG